MLCDSRPHRDELHWAHKFPRTRTSAWVYAPSHHVLWRKEISLETRVSSSISYYSIWKMICQGDLGPHEGKIRISMARSLGEVKWIDFPEWAQNVKKKKNCIPCESPQKAFPEKLSIIRNMPVISFLGACLMSLGTTCLQRQQGRYTLIKNLDLSSSSLTWLQPLLCPVNQWPTLSPV